MKINDNYPTCERTSVELRVYPGEMAPLHVTEQLQIPATTMFTKGESKTNSIGRTRIVKKNVWILSSEESVVSKDCRRHLCWLLDLLEPVQEKLCELQRSADLTMYVSCVWWSAHGDGGPTLSPDQMARLAALNLELGFEISFYEGGENPFQNQKDSVPGGASTGDS